MFLEGVALRRRAFLVPPEVFLLLGAERQLLGSSANTLWLLGWRWGGGVCLLGERPWWEGSPVASGPLGVGAALPLALMGTAFLLLPDGDRKAAQCDLCPAHPVPVSGGG